MTVVLRSAGKEAGGGGRRARFRQHGAYQADVAILRKVRRVRWLVKVVER